MRAKALGKGYLVESKNPKKRFDQKVGVPGERVRSYMLAYGGKVRHHMGQIESTVILAQAALYIVSLIAGRKRKFFFDYVTYCLFDFTSFASFDIPNHNIKSNKLHESFVCIIQSFSVT